MGNTYENATIAAGLEAGGDLSTKQYYFMKAHTTPNQVTTNGTAGGPVVGVLMNEPSAAGDAADVCVRGVAPVIAGSGGLTAGQAVMSDNAGKAVLCTQAKFIVGTALETFSAAAVGSVLIDRAGYKKLDPA
ncbi:MAG: DUF2190 family protein [Methylococcaceae bacterium]|nr:DUF2190 family protein [Methylococcaceae bacterium]